VDTRAVGSHRGIPLEHLIGSEAFDPALDGRDSTVVEHRHDERRRQARNAIEVTGLTGVFEGGLLIATRFEPVGSAIV
jgi:hypothetical protein